jgi:hypothetical protein
VKLFISVDVFSVVSYSAVNVPLEANVNAAELPKVHVGTTSSEPSLAVTSLAKPIFRSIAHV